MKQEEFVDEMPEDAKLLVWGFWIGELRDHSSAQGLPYNIIPTRRLLQVLGALPQHRRRICREADLIIWTGDYFNRYWVGTFADVHEAIAAQFTDAFDAIAGYDTMEFGSAGEMGLVPRFRYSRGRLIEYGEPEAAGRTYIDNDRYGSGLTIEYRDTQPEGYLGDFEAWMDEQIEQAAEGGPVDSKRTVENDIGETET